MRTFLKTTLITTLVIFVILFAWSFIYPRSNTVQNARAVAALNVPLYCIPPELAEINKMLAQSTDASQTQDASKLKLLLAKKEAIESGAQKCAENATRYPPAKKSAELATPVPPISTVLFSPTMTLQTGIHDGHTMSSHIFIPTDDIRNMWSGTINGNDIEVVAGFMNDENWQSHPDWPIQGAVSVMINRSAINGGLSFYPTSPRHGELHFIAACGTKLVLQATDGTNFVFDAAIQDYVNTILACPTVTP